MKKDNIIWVFLHLQRSGGTTINGQFFKNLKPEEEFIHVGSPWISKEEKKKRKIISFNQRLLSKRKKAKVISGHLAYYGIHKLVPNKEAKYLTFLRDPATRLVSFYNSRVWKNKESAPSFEEWYNTRRKNEMVNFYSKKYQGKSDTTQIPSFLKNMNSKTKGAEERIFLIKKILGKIIQLKPKNKDFKRAKKMLDLCWFVGIIENSKKDLKYLFEQVGVPNDNWENYSVSGDLNKKEINPLLKKSKKAKFKLDDKTKEKIYKENPLDLELYKYAKKLNQEKKLALK
jgi:hypothetical protein